MDAVILVGGFGTRLRPMTADIPKPLLPICDSSTLDTNLHRLREGGVTRVFLAAGHLSHMLEASVGDGSKWDLDVRISTEEKPLGTAGPLSLLRAELRSPFILMNGDILTTFDFSKFRTQASKSGAVISAVTTTVAVRLLYGRVLTTGEYITAVEEKPDVPVEILAGIYLVDSSALTEIPDDTFFGMDQLIAKLLDQGKKIHRYVTSAYWRDIGEPKHYEKAQEDYPLLFSRTEPQRLYTAASNIDS